MQGNAGADRFVWNSLAETGDIIQDWVTGEDKLVFDAGSFFNVPGAVLIEGVNFISSTAPVSLTANATWLWDSDDTNLFFDADGNGAGAAILIADMQAFSSLLVTDFIFTGPAAAKS